ncbi:hypothetical protein SAMN02745178_00032 [Gemmiger formicilis]|uniref:Uncharacterized protein n=1 Tax=Gemmiger formicilis TaxID=745368 RepID=A0A1T4W6L7_9FIRM|nr:hypothetical protein SAMN02745178_00032 [Gemmiger formicilis]
MVVGVGVAGGFAVECVCAGGGVALAFAGVGGLLGGGGGGGFCRVGGLALSGCGLGVVVPVGAVAVVVVLRRVLVGFGGAGVGQVAGVLVFAVRVGHFFAARFFPYRLCPCQLGFVGLVSVLWSCLFGVVDVLGAVPDLGLRSAVFPGGWGPFAAPLQCFARRARCFFVLLCCLGAGGVFPVVVHTGVVVVCGLLHLFGLFLCLLSVCGGWRLVLCGLWRLVAPGLVAVAPPADLGVALGRRRGSFVVAAEFRGLAGGVFVSRLSLRAAGGCFQCGGFVGGPVFHGPGSFLQRSVWRVADLGVVGGPLPGVVVSFALGEVGEWWCMCGAVLPGLGLCRRGACALSVRVGVVRLVAFGVFGDLLLFFSWQLGLVSCVCYGFLPGRGLAFVAFPVLCCGSVGYLGDWVGLLVLAGLVAVLLLVAVGSLSACGPVGCGSGAFCPPFFRVIRCESGGCGWCVSPCVRCGPCVSLQVFCWWEWLAPDALSRFFVELGGFLSSGWPFGLLLARSVSAAVADDRGYIVASGGLLAGGGVFGCWGFGGFRPPARLLVAGVVWRRGVVGCRCFLLCRSPFCVAPIFL